MPHTLLIPLIGPMQAWGSRSRFDDRDTHAEPTKSGVLGLVCAALGRPRATDIHDLNVLRFGVRADAPGRAATDYQTAQKVARASGGSDLATVTSQRHYLADARFLCGLEGTELALLQEIEDALRDPVWPLSLGRKSFPLTCPPYLPDGSLRQNRTLEQALARARCLTRSRPWEERPAHLRQALEQADGDAVQQDAPEDFAARRFGLRRVQFSLIPYPAEEEPNA